MDSNTYYSEAPDVDQLVSEGIAAAKSNQTERARELLMEAVDWDETNAIAWLWLSSVVDTVEDKEVCLDNVLLLEPNNQAALKGLELIKQQKAPQESPPPLSPPAPPPPQQAEPETRPPKERRTSTSKYKRLPPGGTLDRSLPSETSEKTEAQFAEYDDTNDPLQNELGCPYCIAPTEPEQKRCSKCGKKLEVSVPRKAQTSMLYKVILWLQGLNIAGYVLSGIGTLASISLLGEMGETLGEEAIPSGLFTLIALIALLPGLIYSVFIFIGFLKRWMVVYYLILFQSIMFFIGAVVLGVTFGLDSSIGLGCGGAIIVVALAQLFMVLNLGDDFTFDKYRVYLRTDPDTKTAENFLSRGNLYAKRKMWGMAALHFQRAVQQAPNSINGYLALVLAYLKLGLHDKIEGPLNQAKKLNPNDPSLHQLIEDIQKESSS